MFLSYTCDATSLGPAREHLRRGPRVSSVWAMIIVTTNELPGYRIDHVFGEVFGLTVRSRHLGSNIGAGLKSLAGGELRGITQLLHECREEALNRLAAEAQGKGAEALDQYSDVAQIDFNYRDVRERIERLRGVKHEG